MFRCFAILVGILVFSVHGSLADDRRPKARELARTLGLEQFNGDILIGRNVGEERSNFIAMQKLARLLALASSPELLDRPDTTAAFVMLLPSKKDRTRYAVQELSAEYFSMNCLRSKSAGCDAMTDSEQLSEIDRYIWRGDDQFGAEDSRKAFLAAYRDKILAMVPALPLAFADARPFTLSSYDEQTERFEIEIDSQSPWSMDRAGISFEAPLPLDLPRSWKMSPAEARAMSKAYRREDPDAQRQWNRHFQSSRTPARTALIRYRLKNVLLANNDVILDLAAIGVDIYDRSGLSRKFASMPLPSSTVLDETPPAPAGSLPFLDPLYPRLLAVTLDPDLIGNEAFLVETFRLKREIESRIRASRFSGGFRDVSNWAPIMGNALLTAQRTEPGPEAVDTAMDWVATAIVGIDKTVVQPRICTYSGNAEDPGLCEIRAQDDEQQPRRIQLAKLLDFSGSDWNFIRRDNDDWFDDALATTRALRPQSAFVNIFSSSDDIPTIVALAPSPHWFGVDLPFEPTGLKDASLELQVKSASMTPDSRGRRFLLIELAPRAIRYTTADGRSNVWALPTPAAPSTTENGYRFDILGVKLGMTVDEAVAALGESIAGPEWKRVDISHPDPVFGSAVTFQRSDQYGQPIEKIVLFQNAASRKLVTIGRMIMYPEREFSSHDDAVATFGPMLEKKYGPAFKNDERFHWATDPVTKARMKAGMDYDDACSHYKFYGFYEISPNDPFSLRLPLTMSCGETLDADITRQRMTQVLADTTSLKIMIDAAEAAASAAKPSVPEVKF